LIIKRKEKWGEMHYDTENHLFEHKISGIKQEISYPTQPLLLNIDLTFKCNMKCVHCVAMDMAERLGGKNEKSDLKITFELIDKINKSPFMVLVITGGEPLLPEYHKPLIKLIKKLKNKGIIVDTNGTIIPSLELVEVFHENNVLVRASWDIPHPKEEARLRKYPAGMYKNDNEYMKTKQKVIKWLLDHNINLAIQTVIHKYNYNNNNFLDFPYKLKQYGINSWYIHRFIPSYHLKNVQFDQKEYEKRISAITKIAEKLGIKCQFKKDKRHNSVFLLVKDGELYTQSDNVPGKKIPLGKIGEKIDYFAYVSAPDHAARYVL